MCTVQDNPQGSIGNILSDDIPVYNQLNHQDMYINDKYYIKI